MKLAAVSRVLNESDIIEAFVRHTAHFVDHHIFVDNGSVDGTLRILEQLKDEGFGITVSYWSSEEAISRWKANLEHRSAQEAGKRTWYSAYSIRIAKVGRSHGAHP